MAGLRSFVFFNEISQKDLAEYLGVSKGYMSKLVSGAAKLKPEQMTKLLNNDRGWNTEFLIDSDDELENEDAQWEREEKDIALSQRFAEAISFLKRNGVAKSESAIARRIGVTAPAINMAKNGDRAPSWDMLLNFCDQYPINFWWLRSGEGKMVKEYREIELLQRIVELESRIKELEEKD